MSHRKRHRLPVHTRSSPRVAERSVKYSHMTRWTGGVKTLGVEITSVAPLWIGDHGMIKKEGEEL
jgi:hypothetical protein